MKLIKKFSVVMMVLVMLISISSIQVYAVTSTQDGLKVTLTTDKDEYGKDEQIITTLTVENISETTINDISLENIVPQGYKLADASSAKKDVEALSSGKAVTTTVTYIPKSEEIGNLENNNTEQSTTVATNPPATNPPATNPPATNPQSNNTNNNTTNTQNSSNGKVIATGDNIMFVAIFVGIMVLSVLVIFLSSKKKKIKNVVSLLLCVTILGSVLPISGTNVFAAEEQPVKKISVDLTVKCANKNTNISAMVSYLANASDISDNYTVDFDLNYEGAESLPSVVVKNGEYVTLPEEPTRENYVFLGWYSDKNITQYFDSEKTPINSNITLYAGWINPDIDTDGDGIADDFEKLWNTDKNKADTDGDGLPDGYEIDILCSEPLKADTDDNGTDDGQEDFDADKLTNLQEYKLGTNPNSADSDNDLLTDYDEVNSHKTDPLKKDTDDDGLSDGKEINSNYDPNSHDDCFNIYLENSGDGNVIPSVNIENLSGEQAESLKIEPVDNYVLLDENIPGYLGKAFDFSIDGTFEKATISFEFDSALLESNTFEPCIYYYNEETQLLEELPNQSINNNIVSVETTHFSKYILLNKTDYSKVWENDIRRPSEEYKNMDIIFVVDISMSMDYNDPQSIRKTVTSNFINNLRQGDRSALIAFRKNATVEQALTGNKTATINAVNALKNDNGYNSLSGTNGSAGLYSALEMFNNLSTDNVEKVIVFLTDGEDTTVSYNYNDIISRAVNENVCIYSIGLGDNINQNILKNIASETNGNYYKADVATDLITDFNSIFQQYQDYYTDSNYDGISDYFTSLMCSGVLVTGTGKKLFEGIPMAEIQKNKDYDGDGIKNGDEVEVIYDSKYRKVYLKVNSSPVEYDADKDGVYDQTDKNPIVYEYSGIISRGEFGSIEYAGELYNIVVPDHLGTYITASNQEPWKSIEKMPKSYADFDFDVAKFFAGVTNIEIGEDQNDPKAGFRKSGAMFLSGVLTTLNDSVSNYYVIFDFQKRGNEKRVLIYAGSSDTEALIENYAHDIPYSAHWQRSGNPLSQALFSQSVKEYYESYTGIAQERGTYDLQVTMDSRHKNPPYASYLWIDKKGRIIETPIMYPKDKVEIGKLNWGKFEKLLELDTSKSTVVAEKYQTLFKKIYTDKDNKK